MNAAQQYIDLFRENRDLIDKHSSAILNGRREAAIRDFELLGLPGKNLEEFLHTDVESFYAPDYGLNLARIKPAENIRETFRCAVPDLESRLYFFIGDTFRQGTNGNLPKGVIACSLCEAAAQHPELVDRYYGKLAQTDKDGTVALNTALVQDGFFLFVPRHVKIEEPLQIVNLMHGSHDFLANRRLLVVLEEGAQVRLLSCDHTLDKGNFLTSTVNEIFIGANATFDYYDLEESTLNTHRVSSTFIQQESASNVLVNGITLHNGYTRNNYYITLAGETCRDTSLWHGRSRQAAVGRQLYLYRPQSALLHKRRTLQICARRLRNWYFQRTDSRASRCAKDLGRTDQPQPLYHQRSAHLYPAATRNICR